MSPTPEPPTEHRDAAATTRREQAVAQWLDAALAARRDGGLREWLARDPRRGRRLLRPFEALIRGTAGEALDRPDALELAVQWLLAWLTIQLRPDLEGRLDGIEERHWRYSVGWRPALVALTHYGWAPVPAFPGQHRARPDESVIDRLCALWDVAPSTVYRYLDRARQAMAQVLLRRPLPVPRRLSLRRHAADRALAASTVTDPAAWHRRQAERALARRDPVAALWHRLAADDLPGVIATLRAHAPVLAADPEAQGLVHLAAARPAPPRLQAQLWLVRAVLARTQNLPDSELAACETARQIAQAAHDDPMLGVAYRALGKYQEARDADRAFACYERSVELLLGDEAHPLADETLAQEGLQTLIRLAWLYALRQHPRTRETLARAEALADRLQAPDRERALIEDAWGEYWRLTGEFRRAIESRQRALLRFEQAGDRRQVLATLLNLILAYVSAQDFSTALLYADRFFDQAGRDEVEPEMLVNAYSNVGVARHLRGELDLAILNYERAMEGAAAADLRLHVNRNRYNLAEALYQRYAQRREPADEQRADALLAALLAAPGTEVPDALRELARGLKSETLAPPRPVVRDQLLDEEAAAHFEANAGVKHERERLAAGLPPADAAQAHLRIAAAYLDMAARERDAALALAARHGLGDTLAAEVDGLRHHFERAQPQEARLSADWAGPAGDLLDDGPRLRLAATLLRDGAISKKVYGEVCGVSPATASKHLGLLAARGLLVQSGKGPATRYHLP